MSYQNLNLKKSDALGVTLNNMDSIRNQNKKLSYVVRCIYRDLEELDRHHKNDTPEMKLLIERRNELVNVIGDNNSALSWVAESTGRQNVRQVSREMTEQEIDNIKKSAVQEFLDNLKTEQSTTA